MATNRKQGARVGLAGSLALAVAAPLATAGITAAVLGLTAGTAGAACPGAGSGGTVNGCVTLAGGSLSISNSGLLSFSGTINGLDQFLNDTTAADTGITVTDATGSGAGWHLNVSQTQFSDGNGHTLPFLALNGSTASSTATTAVTSACFNGSTCTNATNSVTYPLTLSGTAQKMFNAAASTGIGSIGIGTGTFGVSGNNPVSWWISVPASALAGTYTSTITEAISTGP